MASGSLLARWNTARALLAPSTGVLQDNWDGLFDLLLHDHPHQPINLVNSGQAVTRAIANMLPDGVAPATRAALLQYAASPGILGSAAILADRTKLRVGLGMLIAAVASTQEFQFRG
jgi:hypothetical protein